jgi:hypothetical protein
MNSLNKLHVSTLMKSRMMMILMKKGGEGMKRIGIERLTMR